MTKSLNRTVDPTAEPLDLERTKTHLKIDGPDEDEYVLDLIAVARAHIEGTYGIALVTQTWELRLEAFPGGVIECKPRPVASITGVQYVDTAGVLQTWDASLYDIDTSSEPARVVPAYGKVYPPTRQHAMGAVRVMIVAGYGAAYTDVPPDIRHALRLVCGFLHAERGDPGGGLEAARTSSAVRSLMSQYWRAPGT